VLQELVFDQKERVGAWVAEQVGQSASWGSFSALGVERNGELLAGIVFNNFNGHNATCHIAVTKSGKHLIALLQTAAEYAFEVCQLKRLTGLVEMSNVKALTLNKHMGWEEEFVMKSAAADGGDLQVLVMWRDTCRWLKKEHP
jgi:RimJ/RimL family protein N-acetyltransferase